MYSWTVSAPGARTPESPAESRLRIEPILERIGPKLLMVEDELRRHFDSRIETIRDVGEHILAGGGKRLRPALVLLVADMLGYRGTRDVVYGAVIELIHTATLVHDDIIDEAAVRRGKTSINYRWGNHLTVLVGDYLYTRALNTALREDAIDFLRLLSETTVRMTEGEILALERNGRADLTSEDYFDIVERKTAALFGASARVPGFLVDVAEADSLYDYGLNLGICFQLVDDLLDFTSSVEVLGKPVLSDLREGKMTLPLILAMPQATESERRLIEQVVTEKSFGRTRPEDIIGIASRYEGLERTFEIARDYAGRARRALAPFPASPARDALESAIDFVLHRDR